MQNQRVVRQNGGRFQEQALCLRIAPLSRQPLDVRHERLDALLIARRTALCRSHVHW
jgi:hypothetical protein